ncbi:hypothetical protein BU17DRAFT_63548 [Hysterangium stoloniferum]|nr:hypothetical protein BU17DRAFT_63548 [Hysterangium stoloniferum]
MGTTLNGLPDTTSVRATNAFYLSGLILDLMAACLAFLSSRWFQRLTNDEKNFLQDTFTARAAERVQRADPTTSKPKPNSNPRHDQENGEILKEQQLCGIERLLIPWYSLSLFIPVVFLELGAVCIVAGLYTYTWSQQSLPVALVVSFAGISTIPFVIGVVAIGTVEKRRRNIILQLSRIQGDW